jgi:hypothetical protein
MNVMNNVDTTEGVPWCEQCRCYHRATAAHIHAPAPARVTVTDVRIPFQSLMWLFVKGALALVPASIIIAMVWFAALALFRAM